MASIPADTGLVLGNVVDRQRIKNLMAIAEAQKPQVDANDRLNDLMQSNHKLKMIFNTMVQQEVDIETLAELDKEKELLKDEMAGAAVELAEATIKAELDIFTLKQSQQQTTITMNVESPIDYTNIAIKRFELSFDSLKFDVQYFRKEDVDDSSNAHASAISSFVASQDSDWKRTKDYGKSDSTHSSVVEQSQNHDIEGTIVITANCTHKMADVLAPFVLDARKAIDAWNYTYEDDAIDTDAASVFEAATTPVKQDENKIHLLSGVTKGSSFVGYVHILRSEKTQSSQRASSTASAVRASIQSNLWYRNLSGGFGVSASSASTASSLLSSSQISNQVNLIVQGCIPSIVANDVPFTIKRLAPTPEAVMGQLAAVQGASNDSVNQSPAASAANVRKQNQFTQLNSAHTETTIEKIAKENTEQNKVIDTNSMMNAFTDYVNKCREGNCGIPINYFLKEISKADVAKCYIRKFYPMGASGLSSWKGAIGQEPEQKQ
mmetsp:Transcript_25416/g.38379  ORF Transcript_25416/g.38379 Transcript_25416/m.38379 type:complete len:493 (-) Transcript_25416:41-1519(-)